MWIALGINACLLVIAVVGGIAFDSLAALADAGHVLSDLGAIALGVAAAALAARRAGSQRTFGYHRGEVLAALVNGLALVAIAVVVVVAAIGRLGDPPDIEAGGVLAVGLLGLAGNAWATLVLARGERSDINLEAVLRHSAAAALDVDELGAAMCEVEGVGGVHELHVWTVTSGFEALAAHVVTRAGADRDRARREIEFVLGDRFGIEHTTLQMEESGDEDALLQVQLQRP